MEATTISSNINVFTDIDESMTLEDLNRINHVKIYFSMNTLGRVRSALSELFRNSWLEFEESQRDDLSLLDMRRVNIVCVAPEPFYDEDGNWVDIPSEQEVNIVENDHDVTIYGCNFTLKYYVLSGGPDAIATYPEMGIDLEWNQDTNGYWTWPGVLMHRLLGQSLRVFIPSNDSE